MRLLSKKQKQRLLALSNFKVDDTDDDYYDDRQEIHVSPRRPEVVKPDVVDNADLTDEIKLRLAIARSKALKKYEEVWS